MGSTHTPPQLTRLAWHETWQVPPEQTSPESQTFPQVPQFVRSTPRSAQYVGPASLDPASLDPPSTVTLPPQSVSFDAHVVAQAPPLHASPLAHDFPQPPQFALSVSVFAQ